MSIVIAIFRIGFDEIVSVLFYAALIAGSVVLALVPLGFLASFAVNFVTALVAARHPRDDRFVLVVDDWAEHDDLDVPGWVNGGRRG